MKKLIYFGFHIHIISFINKYKHNKLPSFVTFDRLYYYLKEEEEKKYLELSVKVFILASYQLN